MSEVEKAYYSPYKIKAAVGQYLEEKIEIDKNTNITNKISVTKGISASINLQGTLLVPTLSHLLTGELRYNVYRGTGSDKHTALFINTDYLVSLNRSKDAFLGPAFDVRRLSSSKPQTGLGARMWIIPALNLKLTRWITPNNEISAELGCASYYVHSKTKTKEKYPIEFKMVFSDIYNKKAHDHETLLALEFKLGSLFNGWGPWIDTDTSWKSAMRFGAAKSSFKELPNKSEKKK